MNTQKTSIVSCYGIIGCLIALIYGKKNSSTKHFIRQSVNSLISRWSLIGLSTLCIIMMGINMFTIFLSILVLAYNIYILLAILNRAKKLCVNPVLGILEIF